MITPSEVFHFEGWEKEGANASAIWQLPADCPYLAGHFPGQPVLPAVGLIDGSLEFLRRSGAKIIPGQLTLKKAKFTGMVIPGLKVRLSLQHREDRWDVEWRNFENAQALASFSFRI